MLIILGLTTPTLLTLPAFKALFDSQRGNVNNVNNVKAVLKKKVLGRLVMLIMSLMSIFSEGLGPPLQKH